MVAVKLLAANDGVREVTVNEGRVIKPKKGVFNVNGIEATILKQSGDFTVAGTTFQTAKGYRCSDCKRVNVFKDKCGKCGSTNLTPEA